MRDSHCGASVACGRERLRGAEAIMTCVALVVMEPGSDWPGHVGDSETLVALRSEQDMVGSTREKLDALRRGRQDISVAVLACNGATDRVTTDRRAKVAGELLASVSRAWRGRLVLTASAGRASGPLRQHLLSLAGTLSDNLRGTSATVTLKFTEPHDRDRIFSWPAQNSPMAK
jgi:hypothetical protein